MKCKKIMLLLVAFILLIYTVGCDGQSQKEQETVVIKETDEPSKSKTEPVDNTEPVEAEDEMAITNFKPLQESFIDYNFNVELKVNDEQENEFLVTGEYDLNEDGILETIKILLKDNYRTEEEQPYIEINHIKQKFFADYIIDGEVKLIDLDKKDNFIEVAIFDEGPSWDPHYKLYRFDGKQLYRIGDMDSNALINGEGKVISGFDISHFEPAFYSAWYEIEDNKFAYHTKDITDYMGKSYKFKGGEVFFTPAEEMPQEFSPTWEESRYIEPGEIKVIDKHVTYDIYFVELSNGEKGMLYFWIGD